MKSNSRNLVWRSLIYNCLAVSGILIFNCDRALGQVIPDNTLGNENSVVNPRDTTSDSIDGGAIRGQNLFHSFQEFNVDAGRGVYFANPDDVTNIFSRVTGNNVSNILGTLGVDGAADLFLINPNGIVFGEGASLDVQGSFTATTASGIEFSEQGIFDAINPQIPQLLTIDPSAYLFNQIQDQAINSISIEADLGVPEGKNLVFLGGDIEVQESLLIALNGRIEIGELKENGIVELDENHSLTTPNLFQRSNVSILDNTLLGVDNEGSVNIFADNINLLNNSRIIAGIVRDLGDSNTVVGDIKLQANNNLFIEDSVIENVLGLGLEGTVGNIEIFAKSLLIKSGQLSTSINGIGQAGNISLSVTDSIVLDGETQNGSQTGIFSNVFVDSVGNSGNIDITTDSLFVTNGAQIGAGTFGNGDGGTINISASDNITFNGQFQELNFFGMPIPSGASATVQVGATGDAGNINLNTGSLFVTNGAQVQTGTFSNGSAGSINITAIDQVVFDGGVESLVNSSADSSVGNNANGNAGGVSITSDSLQVINGGQITAFTRGDGNSGVIDIVANSILLDGEDELGINSVISSAVQPRGEGNAGGINITTGSLEVLNGAMLDSSTFDRGDAGTVEIKATDTITIDGADLNGTPSGVISGIDTGAEGNAGGIKIVTDSLSLNNSGVVSSSTFGQGTGGEIEVKANSLILDRDASISSSSESTFNAGNIILNITDYLQTTGSEISSSSTQSSGGSINIFAGNIELRENTNIRTNISSGEGGGGDINLTANSIIAFDDSDIFAFAADGQGGNITLNTPAFFAENFTLNSLTSDPDTLENNNRADINATGAVSGAVDIPDVSFIQNSLTELPDNSINTNELVANSCVSPVGNRQQGRFIITGGDSLPVRPGNANISNFATGEVRSAPQNKNNSWQPGDPIIEPQGLYRLANGKLVLSRECN